MPTFCNIVGNICLGLLWSVKSGCKIWLGFIESQIGDTLKRHTSHFLKWKKKVGPFCILYLLYQGHKNNESLWKNSALSVKSLFLFYWSETHIDIEYNVSGNPPTFLKQLNLPCAEYKWHQFSEVRIWNIMLLQHANCTDHHHLYTTGWASQH